MIRYVLAVVLLVALLALSMPAIDSGATMNTERQVDASLAAIDENATSLIETEEVTPDGHPNPQRVVDLSLPRSTLTTAGVDHVELVPHESGQYTHARYVLEDGTTRETIISEQLVWDDPSKTDTTELDGGGEQRLALVLLPDETGEPTLVARHV